MSEVKPCPSCGSSCISIRNSFSPTGKVISCSNIKCQYQVGSDVAHNTLCADIEKGRKYDDTRDSLDMAGNLLAERTEQRDKAVELLSMRREHFLASIDKGEPGIEGSGE